MTESRPWQQIVRERLALFGHRNWIVVADAAYPVHSATGIETILADCDFVSVLTDLLGAIESSGHVTATVFTDCERDWLEERDAPGIDDFRERLRALLGSRPASSRPHDEIIAALDEAAATFRVLIVKTTLEIPYTSVFLQLGCGYWSRDADEKLRSARAGKG